MAIVTGKDMRLIFELAAQQKIIVAGMMLTNFRLPCHLKYQIIFCKNGMEKLTRVML